MEHEMECINQVSISGNITRDPELRTGNVLKFSVAVNDRRKVDGEWKEVPNFIDCVMFGARAEALSNMIHKGTRVSIGGKLRYSSWEKDGQKRSKVEVAVDQLDFLSKVQEESDDFGW